jgi:hypothetical protein
MMTIAVFPPVITMVKNPGLGRDFYTFSLFP